MSEDADFRNIVADVAAAYFRRSRVKTSEIPAVISQIAIALSAGAVPHVERSLEPPAAPKLSSARIRKSITPDALISFEDNKPYKILRPHLAARGMSPDEYRSKWGLPKDYPMAAPSYREARASQAKARGGGAPVALNAAPSSPETTVAPAAPDPEKTAALAEAANIAPEEPALAPAFALAPAPVAAISAPLAGLRTSRPSPKSASTPTAFRPREPVRDPEAGIRHKRWLAMLSEADWARIRVIARQVNPAHVPAALSDLSAPLRVRLCPVGHEARFPGEHVGTLRSGQVAVLISELGEH